MDQDKQVTPLIDEPLATSLLKDPSKDECKLCLQNVPKFITAKDLQPKLETLLKGANIAFKVQKNPKNDCCILMFADETERRSFESFIENQKLYFPKCKKPLSIISVTKRKIASASSNFYLNKKHCSLPLAEQIQDQVTKFWRLPYEEQLNQKKKNAISTLSKINYGQIVKDTIPSPILVEYRNKCEFTIGLGGEFGKSVVVGFTMGTYGDGNLSVVSPSSILIIHPVMKELVSQFETWLINSHYEEDKITPKDEKFSVYNRITHLGYWRLLLLRLMDDGKSNNLDYI